jgi:protein farnesyltransferase/geranylgeranyltransferase type-1 subunit alpha
MNTLGPFNPKNYQIWYYRRELLLRHNDASVELSFVNRMLEDDSKNIHAWGYRQWVIQRFGLWNNELSYSEKLIEEDVKNNSAWTQRYFVVANTQDLHNQQVLETEIDYACKQIRLCTLNESSWNYLRGLFQDAGETNKLQVTDFPRLKTFAYEIFEIQPKCRFALQFLAFYYEKERKHELALLTLQILKELDYIRAKYWAFRMKTVVRGNWLRDATDLKYAKVLVRSINQESVTFAYYRGRYN